MARVSDADRFLGMRAALIFLSGAMLFAIRCGAQGSPSIDGCPIFPPDNIWNTPVDALPLDPLSDVYIATIGGDIGLHPDFGSGVWDGGPIGIPFNVVPGTQAKVPVTFDYADESDPGPYPIPPNPAFEWGSDRHVLILDRDNAILYELYAAQRLPDGSVHAGSGAIFSLLSNALRPDTWTSADAAGLPMLSGLVRYDEARSGEIRHALRFTAPETGRAYVWPARHYASDLTDSHYPPMGQRFRLKDGFDISPFSSEVQVILRAMKKFGIILADNGAAWYIGGAPDERWNNDELHLLDQVTGADFEAVDVSSLMIDPNSGQARQSAALHPEVRANGAEGSVIVPAGQPLSVTVSLPDGSLSGAHADWWVVALAGSSWYYLNSSDRWIPFDGNLSHCHPVYQGALFDLPATEVLNMTGFPVGSYTFWFAVDSPMDGILNINGQILVDEVDVTVQ